MRKKILRWALGLTLLCALLAALNSWHIESLDLFVKEKISQYSKSQLPINILPGKVEVQLIPLRLKINQIKIQAKGELKQQVKDFEIQHLELSPSISHLILGKMHLSYLSLEGVPLHLNLKIKDEGGEFSIQLEKILSQIPISELELKDIQLNLNLTLPKNQLKVHTERIAARLINETRSLSAKIHTPELKVVLDDKTLMQQSLFSTHFYLTNKNLILSDLKWREKESFLLASGTTQHHLAKNQLRSSNINVRSQVDLDWVKGLYTQFLKEDETNPLEDLQGEIRADMKVNSTGFKDVQAQWQAEAHNLVFEKFHIGNIAVEGTLDTAKQTALIKQAKIENDGLEGSIEKIPLNLENLSFKESKVKLKRFQLDRFLKYALNLDVPIKSSTTGELSCEGTLEKILITCKGDLHLADLDIKTGKDPKTLVRLAKASAQGQLQLTAKEISYTAALKTQRAQGHSEGVINFLNGFDIRYTSENVDFDEVKEIAGLEVKGLTKIDGVTQGNSHTATFQMNIDGQNIHLEKYALGDASFILAYNSGLLTLQKIQGTLDSSRYLGQLEVDLEETWLRGDIQLPFVDLGVAQESIKEHLPIPVPLSGSGSAVVHLDSPLNPNKLSFDAKARIYNGRVDQQHFDSVDAKITSDKGRVTLNSVVVEEKSSKVVFTGELDLSDKTLGIQFKSDNYFLEDVQYIKNAKVPAKGSADINGQVRGTFQKPEVIAKVTSSNFNIAGENLSPLKGRLLFSKEQIEANFEGPKKMHASYKDHVKSAETLIEANIRELNVAPLLTHFIGIQQIDDYKIMTTSSINLKMNKKDSSMINGYANFTDLSIQFQKTNLRNEKEISLFFTNGKLNFSPFALSDSDNRIQLKSTSSAHPVDLDANGVFNLSFLHLFTPFLETIEGTTTLNLKLRGNYQKMDILGSAFIEDGFIKLPEIQHAVEDLKIDLLLNRDQININSIKGRFAGGQLLGDGKAVLKGVRNIPLEVNLHLDNIDLNLPAQVNTKGSADLKLTGSWLPFVLSGTYKVSDGLISKELSGADTMSANPHHVFLPPVLRDEGSTPIRLDLGIIPTAPLRVKNTMIDGRIEGKIKVTGSPQTPILGGNIALTKSSQIVFMDIIFRVRDSSFTLNNTSPPNPVIYLVAETRYRGYDIELLVQGNADKPRFKWSSSPTLTEQEIVSLLTLGTITSQQQATMTLGTESTTNINANNNTTGVGVQNPQQSGAAIFSQNPLSREIKNRFGFDVQFSSRFDTANSVAVPRISAAKQIDEKTSLIGSYQTGRESRSDLILRYQLNRDFSASMNMQSLRQEEANQQRGNNLQQSDILGIDLEFRKEFK